MIMTIGAIAVGIGFVCIGLKFIVEAFKGSMR